MLCEEWQTQIGRKRRRAGTSSITLMTAVAAPCWMASLTALTMMLLMPLRVSCLIADPRRPSKPYHSRRYALPAYRREKTSTEKEKDDSHQRQQLNDYTSAPDDIIAITFPDRNMTMSDMVVVSSLGTVLSLGLVYSLATTGGYTEVTGGEQVIGNIGIATENVLDAMLPSTATDLVSITVGEALAGALGAASTFALSIIMNQNNPIRPGTAAAMDTAVADGDFFLASAAAFPIIESLGMSPIVSSVLTAVFASVPYELVKYGSRQREQRLQEDKVLQQLLEKQKVTKRQSIFTLSLPSRARADDSIAVPNGGMATDNRLDFVEIFSDLIRWLEYGILMTDFGGQISIIPGVESAIYGVLATLSSQAYGDLLYGVFGFGGEQKRDEVRARTASSWSSFYLSRALYAATLFGVYDAAQIPAKRALNALLSGSYVACFGSVDYNLCTESFLFHNPPPSPSFVAQIRALCTSLYSLWNQLGFDSLI